MKTFHDIGLEGDFHVVEPEEQERSFDAVKCINFDSVKSIKCNKLESSTSPGHTHTVYKVDTGANGNLMSLKHFKTLLQVNIGRAVCHKK